MKTTIYFKVDRREIKIGALDYNLFQLIKVPGMTVVITPECKIDRIALIIPGRKLRAMFLPGGSVGVIPYRCRHHLVIFPEKMVTRIVQPDGTEYKNWFLCPNCESLNTLLDQAIPIIGTIKQYWNMHCQTCHHEWGKEYIPPIPHL